MRFVFQTGREASRTLLSAASRYPFLLCDLCASVVRIAGLLLLALSGSALAQTVDVDFFYAPNCTRCAEVTAYVATVSNRYAPHMVIHVIDLSVISNYEVMVAMEETMGIRKNETLVIFVGSNALHGADAIVKGLDAHVARGIAFGGVAQWRPACVPHDGSLVKGRFDKFTWSVIVVSGLADGINPCAFAVLVMFASMLASYRKTPWDIMRTALVFSLGVALTYTALGLALFTTLHSLIAMPNFRTGMHVVVGIGSIVLGILSLRDAWVGRHSTGADNAWLVVPPRLRERIHRVLHERTGRTLVLTGVFMAGVLVSLMESVCTGQLYVPTCALMVQADTRGKALAMLGMYNLMFIVPLLALSVAVSWGVRSLQLVALMKRQVLPARILMALLFVVVGIALLVMVIR